MSHFNQWNLSVKGLAFDPETGESFFLNDLATLIFKLSQDEKSAEEIAKILESQFEVSFHQALTDVLEFLVQLNTIAQKA